MKITGIKKAVGDFNNWQGNAIIYFDKSNNEVWTNVYSGDSWDVYKDENIKQVHSKFGMIARDDKTTMLELKEMCKEVLK